MLSREDVLKIGFASVGENVQISPVARFYGAERIHLGNNVRIDDFCVFSAGSEGIEIGNFVHIAVFCSLIGKEKIRIGDFSTLSSRVAIYTSSDDYSGQTMTNPTIPEKYKSVIHAPVNLGRHVIVGSGSVILPGPTIGEAVAIGALSLIKESCDPFWIYAGSPAIKIRPRKSELLTLEQKFTAGLAFNNE